MFLFAVARDDACANVFYRIVNAVQGSSGQSARSRCTRGFLHAIEHVFNAQLDGARTAVAAAAAAYAILEGAEAVGLWYQKRWAEYLTFIATLVFLPVRDLRAVARR